MLTTAAVQQRNDDDELQLQRTMLLTTHDEDEEAQQPSTPQRNQTTPQTKLVVYSCEGLLKHLVLGDDSKVEELVRKLVVAAVLFA